MATPHDASDVRPGRVGLVVGSVGRARPLGDVSGELEDPFGCGARFEARRRRELVEAVASLGARDAPAAMIGEGAVEELTPRITAPLRAAGSALELRFGGEPRASKRAVAPRVVPGDEDGGQLRARQPLRPARGGEGTTASWAHAVRSRSDARLAPSDPGGGHRRASPPELVREGFGAAGGRFGIAVTVSGRVEHLVPARAELDRGGRE